VHGKPILTEA